MAFCYCLSIEEFAELAFRVLGILLVRGFGYVGGYKVGGVQEGLWEMVRDCEIFCVLCISCLGGGMSSGLRNLCRV